MLGIDTTIHNDLYYFIISQLITYKFGDELSGLIHFYIYERKAGGKLKTEDGTPIKIDTPEDLWDLVQECHDKMNQKKK